MDVGEEGFDPEYHIDLENKKICIDSYYAISNEFAFYWRLYFCVSLNLKILLSDILD